MLTEYAKISKNNVYQNAYDGLLTIDKKYYPYLVTTEDGQLSFKAEMTGNDITLYKSVFKDKDEAIVIDNYNDKLWTGSYDECFSFATTKIYKNHIKGANV